MPLNPSSDRPDVGASSMWCRQDSDSNTILHRAVLKKHDISVIDVILRADPSVCRVQDRSGRFPMEVVLYAKGDQFLYEELPLQLVCKLLGKKNPADLELVHKDYSSQELLSCKQICCCCYCCNE